MRIFVTAGNTQVPIDRVRCITNIFTGRTGAAIALEAYRRGHQVTLATSHPEVIDAVDPDPARWCCIAYRTFDQLEDLMTRYVALAKQDAVVHCAAVADYLPAGIFAATQTDKGLTMHDRAAPKIKSDEPELWLRLVRAPKLVDKVRGEWGFHGVLVKFKLEVGISKDALLAVAEKSRQQSSADWMVANSLTEPRALATGASESVLLGNAAGYREIARTDLPSQLLTVLEKEAPHG